MATTRRRSRPRSVVEHQAGLSGHRRLGLAAAIVATVGLTIVGVAGATRRQPPPSDVERQIRSEIDAMVDSGMSEDDPKIELLEEQADELRRGSRTDPPREPGIDLAERMNAAKAAEQAAEQARDQAIRTGASSAASAGVARQATTGGVPTGPAWQSGSVECEPIPQILTAEELAGAICVSVPQPDGSSRYVAVGADGVVRTVAFGADGRVGRKPDRSIAGGVAVDATAVAPTAGGDIRVTVRGKPPVTVDVG
jgi:hypothetical protein